MMFRKEINRLKKAIKTNKNIVAIIPARGGSKSISQKNIRKLLGKPLIEYSIKHSFEIELIDRTIVSTDDKEISRISSGMGAEVIIRPKELATDTALVIDTIIYTVKEIEKDGSSVDIIVVLEPTSPIRDIDVTKTCINILLAGKADSVATFSETEISPHRMWSIKGDKIEPFLNDANPWLPRQSQPKAYKLNGQVYALTKNILFRHSDSKSLLLGKKYPVITSNKTAVDIDTENDLNIAEALLKIEKKNKGLKI